MTAAFFRGTKVDQNVKFKDKDKQFIKQWKWPAEFDQPIDLSKVSTFPIQLSEHLGGVFKLRMTSPTFLTDFRSNSTSLNSGLKSG